VTEEDEGEEFWNTVVFGQEKPPTSTGASVLAEVAEVAVAKGANALSYERRGALTE
jgi:hypothetical protein